MTALDLLGHWRFEPVLVTLAAAGVTYGVGVRRVRRWPRGRTAAFMTGLLAIAFALASGLDAWSERRLSVHMAQHLLLALFAPLCLVAGAPVRLALGALGPPGRRRLARALRVLPLRPATGWAAFTVVMVGTHLTGVYELALRDPLVHELEHVAYLLAGVAFWAPLIGADPLPHRAGPAAKLAWMLAAMPPMGLVGARLLTGGLAYPSYAAPAAALGIDPLADQRTAAGVMWGAGSLLMSAALVWIVFSALVREEARQRRREALR